MCIAVVHRVMLRVTERDKIPVTIHVFGILFYREYMVDCIRLDDTPVTLGLLALVLVAA